MSANVFLAVDLSDDERHSIAAALTEAGPGRPIPGRRTHPDTWHVTLRFLGPLEDPTLDRIEHELSRSIDVDRFTVSCSGIGAFPRPSKATVVYAGIEDREGRLDALSGLCEGAARDVGLEPEERPFVPHLTLARVRPPVDVRPLFDVFGEFRERIRVDAVSLMRTIPGRGGVRYETIAEVPLR